MAAEDAISQPRGHQDHRLARPLRLGAVVAAALLLLAGLAPASSSAAERVIVHTPNGDRAFTDDDFAQPDVIDQTYILRSSTSQDNQPISKGTSVTRLLQEGGIAPSSGFLRLTRADGSWATLTADDLKDPPPFQNGLKPVLFLDGVRVRYLRPVRDDSDVNAPDYITTVGENQPLELWLQSGNILTVKASASTNSTSTGTPITYSVDPIGGGKNGESYTVTWKFDDGATATGTSVTHAFANTGSYGASATAQGDEGSGGASNQVIVRVGNPPQTGNGPGAGSTSTPSGPATGQAGSGPGGTGTGSTTQPAGGSGGPTGQPGTPLPKQRDANRSEHKPRKSSPTAPTPAAPATGSGSGSGSGSGAGTAAGAGSGSASGTSTATTPTTSAPTTAPKHAPRKRRPVPHSPSGPFVRGVLVSATATPVSGNASASGQRAGRKRISEPGGDDLAIPVTAIGVLALLGLGLWRERRAVRRGTVAPA